MDLVDDPRDFEVVTGGRHDVEAPENSLKIQDLGRYAVDEYNKEKNALLEFDKVVNAQTQVVCGLMTHLTLEVKDGDKKNVYKAGVLEQPWMSFKGLRYFSLVE